MAAEKRDRIAANLKSADAEGLREAAKVYGLEAGTALSMLTIAALDRVRRGADFYQVLQVIKTCRPRVRIKARIAP